MSVARKDNTITDNILKTMGVYLKYQKHYIIIAIIMLLIQLAYDVLLTYLPGWLVDEITLKNNLESLLIKMIAVVLFIGVLELLMKIIIQKQSFQNECVSQEVSADIKKVQLTIGYEKLEDKTFQNLIFEAIKCTETWGGKRILSDLPNSFWGLIGTLIRYVIFGLLLSSINPIIAIILTFAPVLPFLMVRRYQNFQKKNKDKWTYFDRAQWYILSNADRFEAGKDIRLYSMQKWFMSFYQDIMYSRDELDSRLFKKKISADLTDLLILLLRDGLCYYFLINKIVSGQITIGTFVIMLGAVNRFSECINEVFRNAGQLKKDSIDISSLHNVLDYLDISENEKESLSYNNFLTMKDIYYTYNGASAPTLKGVNLTIKKGEKIAIVGLNGAGKTTLIKVLCGLYIPTKGNVAIDGVESNSENFNKWRGTFSCLFQDINIMPYTIREIVSACPSEMIDDERVKKCLKEVGMLDKINDLPLNIFTKFNKRLNEGGVDFSGGEKQRLLLARALYRNAPVVILDEPTSAMDPLAEESLYKMYNNLLGDKTIIFVSHRLSSTRFCDRIIFLKNGNIAESGNYDELMSARGEYAEMFISQSKYYTGESVCV
jgi:ABC-type multidrug transport system fused ATPase/permease subunit